MQARQKGGNFRSSGTRSRYPHEKKFREKWLDKARFWGIKLARSVAAIMARDARGDWPQLQRKRLDDFEADERVTLIDAAPKRLSAEIGGMLGGLRNDPSDISTSASTKAMRIY
jgi:hypothetical protein